jgi:hypothetical protein
VTLGEEAGRSGAAGSHGVIPESWGAAVSGDSDHAAVRHQPDREPRLATERIVRAVRRLTALTSTIDDELSGKRARGARRAVIS